MSSAKKSTPTKKKSENILYVDSSYNWKTTVNGTGTGRICIVVNSEDPIIREETLSFPKLRQLNNRFELLAIQEAIKIIRERKLQQAVVYSDSQIAVSWSKHPCVRWIGRENNLAGLVFDAMKPARPEADSCSKKLAKIKEWANENKHLLCAYSMGDELNEILKA